MRRTFQMALAFAVLLTARSASAAIIFENFPPALSGFDASARAYALGFNSGAVFWGDLAVHANPALLGYATGVDYEQGRTAFDGDVVLRTKEVTVGHGGLGLLFAGQPFSGMDGVRSDFGGLGSDRQRTWGAGASAAGIWRSWAAHSQGEVPTLFRHADLALGYVEDVEVEGAPGFTSRTVSHALGLLARTGGVLHEIAAMPVRGDVALGTAWRRDRVGSDLHSTREDVSARLQLLPAPALRANASPWLAPALDQLLSVAVVYRNEQNDWGETFKQNGYGGEIGVTRLFAFQYGRQDIHQEESNVWGYTVSVPIRDIAEVRYQHSRYNEPEFSFDAWSVTVDPFALARLTRSR